MTTRLALPRRIGLSLVETLVAAGLSTMVLALMWQIFLTGRRQAAHLEARLASIQGAQLLIERIRQDLVVSVFTPRDTRPIVESVAKGKSNRLNLLCFSAYQFLKDPSALYDPNKTTPEWIHAERVSYIFDPTSHRMKRYTPSQTETLTFARFVSVSFEPGQPGSDAGEDSFSVDMECASDESFVNPKVGALDHVHLTVSLPLMAQATYIATDWADTWFHLAPQITDLAPSESFRF